MPAAGLEPARPTGLRILSLPLSFILSLSEHAIEHDNRMIFLAFYAVHPILSQPGPRQSRLPGGP